MNSLFRLIARSNMRLALLVACSALVLVTASPTRAETSTAADPELKLQDLAAVLPELRRGGYVIYMRHSATDVEGKNDAEADLARCETQRNLSDDGKAQASEIGRGIRALRLPVGKVLASPLCRAKDTAKLALGRFEVVADLEFMLDVNPAERQKRTNSLRVLLATRPAAASNTVIVAHTANLREAAGIWPKPEGVAYVFRPLGNGNFEPVAKVLPEEWSQVAVAIGTRR